MYNKCTEIKDNFKESSLSSHSGATVMDLRSSGLCVASTCTCWAILLTRAHFFLVLKVFIAIVLETTDCPHTEGHLTCFHIRAMIIKVSVSIWWRYWVQISFQLCWKSLGEALTGWCYKVWPVLWESSNCLPEWWTFPPFAHQWVWVLLGSCPH